MKAAVLSNVKEITVQDRPKPEINPSEVLVEIQVCGICGTDVHAYQSGSLYPMGTIMGHECSGIVSEVGNDVRNVAVGDRVVINPAPPSGNAIIVRVGGTTFVSSPLKETSAAHPSEVAVLRPFFR
jgi:threonine dehydrogenase-like Zn-dependent dehydrogenase